MKKIVCHQYATGRGLKGYGFSDYSRSREKNQEASYDFSPNNTGLRFSHLPSEYVFEIDPVSKDYRHVGDRLVFTHMH